MIKSKLSLCNNSAAQRLLKSIDKKGAIKFRVFLRGLRRSNCKLIVVNF